jgi:hypothetical protein
MAWQSKDLAVSQPDRALVRVRLKGTCTAEEGLDAKTFRGFQLAGELFLLTSFFIEPELRREFRSHEYLAPQSLSNQQPVG